MKRQIIQKKQIVKILPKRPDKGNKTDYGRVVVWAGSPGMWGARYLVARAAYRVGAGYVILEGSRRDNHFTERYLPEALTQKYSPLDFKKVYAVGPGWGINLKTKNKIKSLYAKKIPNVVLDADALTVVAKYNLPLLKSWVLTPHTGELSRLLKVKSSLINANRNKFAKLAAQKMGCTVLLKGPRSLVACRNQVYEIPTGNSALSKAGSGDVLTGMIAGLLAQGLTGLQATLAGAYIHGSMADRWIKTKDFRGLTPSDLLIEIPLEMKRFNLTKGKRR